MGSGLSVLSSGFWVLSMELSLFPTPCSLLSLPFTNMTRIIRFFGVLQPLRESPSKNRRESFFKDGGTGLRVVVFDFAEFGLLGVGVVNDVSGVGATMAGFTDRTRIDDALEGGERSRRVGG